MASDTHIPSLPDRVALWCLMALGAVIVAWTFVTAVLRCVELSGTGPFAIPAELGGTTMGAPISGDGAAGEVTIESVVLTVDWLPGASRFAGVMEQASLVIATATVVICLILVSQQILHGRIFSRRNTALVAIASITGVVGAAAAPFFRDIAANGVFSHLGVFDQYAAITFEPFPFVLATFIVSVICTAFTIGERLQRDTEGLV